MSNRRVRALALLLSVFLAACGTGSGLVAVAGSGDAATVRFVNATGTMLDLATSGVVRTSNANISPGSGVGCFTIDDPTTPSLTVRQSGTSTNLSSFAPVFARRGTYTLVAYPGASGFVQFLSLLTATTPATGRSALRVVNGSTGLGAVDVHVTVSGAALGIPNATGIGFGGASAAFDVSAGTFQVRLTNSGTTTVVFDAGSQLLEAGRSYTLVVSSATAAILVPDC